MIPVDTVENGASDIWCVIHALLVGPLVYAQVESASANTVKKQELFIKETENMVCVTCCY